MSNKPLDPIHTFIAIKFTPQLHPRHLPTPIHSPKLLNCKLLIIFGWLDAIKKNGLALSRGIPGIDCGGESESAWWRTDRGGSKSASVARRVK